MLRLLSYLTLAFSLGATAAGAQHYPDHPVKVVVGYAAGSGPDIQARTVSAQLSLDLGQQFFVENRTGANGTIGTRAVVQAKPDGYTILYSSNGIAPTPYIYKNLGYDIFTDLTPLSLPPAIEGMAGLGFLRHFPRWGAEQNADGSWRFYLSDDLGAP